MQLIKKILWVIIVLSALYFSYLMLLITLQYVHYTTTAAFLSLKTEEMELSYYGIVFHTHVYTSLFVLLIGFFQFSKPVRLRFPKSHRILGKAYVILVLLLAAPTGLIMGIHGNGGIYSQISFCIQAFLWFIFTGYAFTAIKKGNIALHRKYMVLSFALTLSAISLRLFKWIIVNTLALAPMDTYKIVVWLGWTFNLLVAFIILQQLHAKDKIS